LDENAIVITIIIYNIIIKQTTTADAKKF
jgi:hypothetical protein